MNQKQMGFQMKSGPNMEIFAYPPKKHIPVDNKKFEIYVVISNDYD